MSASDPPVLAAIEEEDDERVSSVTQHRRPSILGLSIVSGLNVVCLAFIAYHFAGHHAVPAVSTGETLIASEVPDAGERLPERSSSTVDEQPSGQEFASGNVAFAPTSRMIVQIASGYDDRTPGNDHINDDPIERRAEKPLTVARATPEEKPPVKAVDATPNHWVQLGALSQKPTALRYWTTLRQRHGALLHDRDARFFGPAEVGGSFYHIRLGPMNADEAAVLCEDLRSDGADCFSLGPDKEG